MRLSGIGSNPFVHVPFLTIGNSKTAWGSTPLPLDLAMIGMQGCVLYTNPLVTIALANTGQKAVWTVPISNDPSYLGITLYTQGGVLSPGANILGVAMSNACELRFGQK